MHDLDLDIQNELRSNVNIPIENPHPTSYLMAIMSALSVVVCEIFAVENAQIHDLDLKVKVMKAQSQI